MFFAIKEVGMKDYVCICQALVKDIDTDSFLGSAKNWEVQEVSIIEAKRVLYKLIVRASGKRYSEEELHERLPKLHKYLALSWSDPLITGENSAILRDQRERDERRYLCLSRRINRWCSKRTSSRTGRVDCSRN